MTRRCFRCGRFCANGSFDVWSAPDHILPRSTLLVVMAVPACPRQHRPELRDRPMTPQAAAIESHRASETYLREEARMAANKGRKKLAGNLYRLADMAHIAMLREKANTEPGVDLWERDYPLTEYRRVA